MSRKSVGPNSTPSLGTTDEETVDLDYTRPKKINGTLKNSSSTVLVFKFRTEVTKLDTLNPLIHRVKEVDILLLFSWKEYLDNTPKVFTHTLFINPVVDVVLFKTFCNQDY